MRAAVFVVLASLPGVFIPLACSEADEVAGTSDAGAADAIVATEGSASDAGAADAPAPDLRILPLALGRRWTYQSRAPDGGAASQCPGEQTAEVVGPGTTRDGGPSLRYHPLCLFGAIAYVDLEGTGDRLVAYLVDDAGATVRDPVLYLDGPVEEGHSWQYSGSVKFVWRDSGSVTVPAGTFTDCWRREEIANLNRYVIYCRGVGQVRHVFPDYEADLTAKNF
jgi:hypothetical protein